MKKITVVFLFVSALLTTGAAGPRFTTPASEKDFRIRYGSNPRSELSAVMQCDTVTAAEKDALTFLYTYLPLPDMADYTPQFYLANVRATMEALREMPWGKDVPDRELRHFVLPVRVNNENPDLSRPAMYSMLKDRLEGLSMEDAILEVNHWCHEKVTYQPSDARTNAPFATMRAALGRCGEESTFTVAALRAVGIPARQVYTPRWAHTDDNHAWVEAWANGRWYFLGACEPEPVLNLGWFNAPASRGMLMTTKVFGRYDGPEEVLHEHPLNTVINVTGNYAPVREIGVEVVDSDGKPVADATVNFSLYNYAEFFPVAVKRTDAMGRASLLAGCGDMVAWASDGTKFGLERVSADSAALIRLDHNAGWSGSRQFDIVPPQPSASVPSVSAEQTALNDSRKATEDSIRMSYTSTFPTRAHAQALAESLGLPADDVARVLAGARGNHAVIERFLAGTSPELRGKALLLLSQLEVKDLNDVTPEVLADHISTPDIDSPLFASYVLNPRVDTEMLTPYKRFFTDSIDAAAREAYRRSPHLWAAWVGTAITSAEEWNPLGLRMSPAAVWRERCADRLSRDIFFVAGARAMGIPARIDPVSGKTQYADAAGVWMDVDFGAAKAELSPQGTVRFISGAASGNRAEPRYYSQFSISKIENGLPVLQNYPDDAVLSDFAPEATFDEGEYMLLTGQRMADGSVLARAEFFPVEAGRDAEIPFEVRRDSTGVQVIGAFNSENIYHDAATGADRSLLSATGRGYYVLGLIKPGHEPSSHALNDLSAVAEGLEAWGKKIMVLLPAGDGLRRFDMSLFPALPSNVVIGSDPGGSMSAEIAESVGLDNVDYPLFIIADTFNRIVYLRQGYTIGLGESLLDVIRRLHE